MERVHLTFRVDAAVVRRALAAVAGGGLRAELDEVLAAARAVRLEQRRTRRVVFDDARRRALLDTLAPLEEDLASQVPAVAVLRLGPLLVAERMALRLVRLRELAAPPVVLEGTRGVIARALREALPDTPLHDDREPVSELDDGPHLHAWTEEILRCARLELAAIEPLGDFDAVVESPPDLELSLGSESTTAGMYPWRALWLPDEAVLPHAFALGVCAGLGGGPPTFAFAGDAVEHLGERMHARVAGLTEAEALVSFVWVPNDVEIGWDEPE